ncbi:MAG TPA: ATP-binding protein [Aliidongia sp.]|nr:ATP-binding protein [Aliidongia sp.]
MGVGSIVSRIVNLHLLAIVVTSTLMPLALYWMLSTAADDLHHRALGDQAAELARYVRTGPDGALTLDLPPRVRDLYSESYGRYEYAILDQAGGVVVSSGDDTPSVADLRRPGPSARFFTRRAGAKILYGAVFPEERDGRKLWIEVSEDLEHRDVLIDDIVADFFVDVGWITIPILVALLFIDIAIFRRALRPVIEASARAQNIGPARTDVRLPTEGMPHEIVPLVSAVNQAFDRLEQGFRIQRDFTGDAAHELRTPLTILRTHVDMLEDQAIAEALRRDIEGMSRIINQLLDIAELETLIVEPGELAEIGAVASEAAGFLAPLAVKEGKQIAVTGADAEIWVEGNAQALFRAVRNLAENALAHTPAGSTVELNLDVDGTIAVLDAGPGVPEEIRPMIFRRFWRADRRRTDGGGLGLAIVARIAEAHGGSVSVANRPSGGAIFTLRLTPTRRRKENKLTLVPDGIESNRLNV